MLYEKYYLTEYYHVSNFKKISFVYLFLIFSFLNIAVCQDLTKQEPIEKIVKFKGETGHSHYYEPNELIFYTGKLYRLILKNDSASKHYFSSYSFFLNQFLLEKYKLILKVKSWLRLKARLMKLKYGQIMRLNGGLFQ